jgi:hypothetical protein
MFDGVLSVLAPPKYRKRWRAHPLLAHPASDSSCMRPACRRPLCAGQHRYGGGVQGGSERMRGRRTATHCCCAARGRRHERLPRCRSGFRSVACLYRHVDTSGYRSNTHYPPLLCPLRTCVQVPRGSVRVRARQWTPRASLSVRAASGGCPSARANCTRMARARCAATVTSCARASDCRRLLMPLLLQPALTSVSCTLHQLPPSHSHHHRYHRHHLLPLSINLTGTRTAGLCNHPRAAVVALPLPGCSSRSPMS